MPPRPRVPASPRPRVAVSLPRLNWRALVLGTLALADVVGFGWIGSVLLTSPDFQIRTVTVTGNRLVATADVVQAANLTGQNVFLARTADAAHAVAALGPVQSATVRIRPPSSAVVEVAERAPRLIWQTGPTRVLVDGTGLVLGPADGLALPLVHDLSNAALPPGTRLDAPIVTAALALVDLIPGEFPGEPVVITYSADEGLGLAGPGQPPEWRAALGDDGGDIAAKLAALKSTLAATRAGLTTTSAPGRATARPAEKKPKTAMLIDLRYRDRVYVSGG